MKDSDSNVRLSKKSNGRTGAKLSRGSPTKSNGIHNNESNQQNNKRTKTTKSVMGTTSSCSSSSGSRATKSTDPSSATPPSPSKVAKKSPGGSRRGNKQSPELRPRRRASQTYFFKYQLARNPLKAEEEDLKLALLASLQQCGSNGATSDNDSKDCSVGAATTSKDLLGSVGRAKSKSQSKNKNNSILSGKRPVGRPPKNSDNDHLSENGFNIDSNELNGIGPKKEKFSTSAKKSQQFKISSSTTPATTTTTEGNNIKRRGSVESNLSSRGSSYNNEAKKVKKNHGRRRDVLLKSIDRDSKTDKPRSNGPSIKSCNDLISVQNKIKKAKKLLQNKQANKNKSNALTGKYSALRKFASNSNSTLSPAAKHQVGSLLMSPTKNVNKSKTRSKLNDCYYNDNLETTSTTSTTSANQYFVPYSPYTPLQRKEPPDEDYLRKYKPETEDFLTFICFRTTAPNKNFDDLSANGQDDSNNNCTTPSIINFNNNNNRNTDKQLSDSQNLKQCTSTLYRLTNINNSPTSNNDHYSPNNHRRPTRQSPRLASSNRKISENDSSNHTMGTSATACDNSITYEEDMKRASIALEDMAQEINSSDDIHNEVAQNSPDCISKLSSPYKNNKHLVKGLMTREFAGAFADEDTIFESISNHKL